MEDTSEKNSKYQIYKWVFLNLTRKYGLLSIVISQIALSLWCIWSYLHWSTAILNLVISLPALRLFYQMLNFKIIPATSIEILSEESAVNIKKMSNTSWEDLQILNMFFESGMETEYDYKL